MLILLLFSVLFYLIVSSFSFNRSILSPSVMIAITFLFGTIFALIGNNTWQVSIQLKTVLFILFSLVSIYLGDSIGKKIKIKDNNSSNIIYTNYSKNFIIFVSLFGFFVCYIYLKQLLSFISFKGLVGLDLAGIRDSSVKSSREEYPINNFTIMLSTFVTVIGLYFSLIFIYIKLYYNSKKKILLLPTIPMFIIFVLQTSRSSFIIYFFSIFVAYTIFLQKKKKVNVLNRIVLLGGRVLILTLILFSALGITTGKTTSLSGAFQSIAVYGGSSILALDNWLLNDAMKAANTDSESFYGFLGFLNHFGSNFSIRPYLPYIKLPNSVHTNIYTAFRAYYADFGIIGLFIICFLEGLVFSIWGKKIIKKESSFLSIMLYVQFFSGIMYSLFTPTLTASLFSVSFFMNIFFSFIVVHYFPKIENSTLKKYIFKYSV